MENLIQAIYFVAAVLFIIGLKRMSSPKTARGGIVWAGLGMVAATLVTFYTPELTNFELMIIAIVVGSAIAYVSAKRVAMTDMPQMIALYNGMGGGAAAAIAAVTVPPRPQSTPFPIFFTVFAIQHLPVVHKVIIISFSCPFTLTHYHVARHATS